jgi:hypothetical protein
MDNYEDFICAGGAWTRELREILARTQGYKTWLDYAKFYCEQRRSGRSQESLADGRPTHRELRQALSEHKRAALASAAAGVTLKSGDTALE